MATMRNGKLSFEVETYDGQEITAQSLHLQQLHLVNVQAYDYAVARCLGIHGFRPASGEWFDYIKNGRGIGPVGIKIMRAIQLNPGVYLAPSVLAELTREEALLDTANVASRVYKLREAHHETKEEQYFVLTPNSGGIAVAWPRPRTWIWVTPIAGPRV